MRPIPASLVAGLVASLFAGPAAAAGLGISATATGTNGSTATTTTTGTTSATGVTTTGTTAATTGSSTSTGTASASIPGTLTSPASSLSTATNNVGASQSTAGRTAITSSSTNFSNGAQYVVNADGTVTMLGSVPTTTTLSTTDSGNAAISGTALSAAVNGTGTLGNGSTAPLNPLAASINGTSPGQTSSGTAAGNSSAGIVDANGALVSGNALNGYATGVTGGGIAVGGMAGLDYGAMADAGSGVNANGERVASLGGTGNNITINNTARTPTPTLDMAARSGMAKELNRRARGQASRIIGIAPRTNVDRTDQMPDDPVIRY